MRKILLCLAAFAMTLVANAQTFNPQRIGGGVQRHATTAVAPQANKAKKAPKAKAPLAANQRLVGAYANDNADTGLGLGSMVTDTIKVGVLLSPSDYAQFADAKVVGIRFAMGADAKSTGIAIYGVNSQGYLNEAASVDTTIVSQSTENADYMLSPVWNTVMLPTDKQFNITSDGNYGFLATYDVIQGEQNFPIAVNPDIIDHGLYVYANISQDFGGSGEGWYNMGSDYGAPAIQLIVEGNFPANGVIPADFGKFTVKPGSVKTVPVTFYNQGSSLNSFAYTYTVNGEKAGNEKTVTLDSPLGAGGSITVDIDFQSPNTAGNYPVVLTVTKANGVSNGSTSANSNGQMIAVARVFQRHVVMEEFTGTGCGWCPRGLVAMKKLTEKYGDNFIGIGIHQYNQSDGMYNPNYANLAFTGAPSCMLDRNGIYLDPYFGSEADIATDIDARLANLPILGVSVKGSYSSDSSKVVATATIDPLVSGNYEIAYVITADSLANKLWRQNNFFSKRAGEYSSANQLPDDLQFLFNLGSSYNAEFNDVLIGSSYNGEENQAGTINLTEGTVAESNYTTDLLNSSKKEMVKANIDYSKVNIIALVIDPNTGAIVNAAKAPVTAYVVPTGINTISNEEAAETVAIYSVSGQRLNGLQHGVNIVKYANGKSVKVLKK